MSMIPGMLFIFLIGSAGYGVFRRLSWPVPAILGSLAFAALVNLAGYYPTFPLHWISRYSNIVIGAYIGLRINRASVRLLRSLILPAIIVSCGMLFLSLLGGTILYRMADFSLGTALLGATTGGIAEMALLAISFGADTASVTLLQIFRLLSAILATPMICRLWSLRSGALKASSQTSTAVDMQKSVQQNETTLHTRVTGLLLLALVATAGALVGYALNLPVGLLTGSIIFVALGNLLGVPFSSLPEFMRILAQIGLGVVVASHITSQTLSGFLAHAALIVLSTGTMLLLSILLGMLLHRMTGWDYPTCLLSTSLGGISQMSIIAEDMGADPLKVSILQTVRLVTILLVLPPLYAYLLTS